MRETVLPVTDEPTIFKRYDGALYELRPYTTGYYRGVHGHSTLEVFCPFCGTKWDVYLWSFAGSGKRCTCGAMLSLRGGAWRKVEPTKVSAPVPTVPG
jgi:hypothetical protein